MPERGIDPLTESRCAVCGDAVDHDWAGEPTHVSYSDDDHAPVIPDA
jgi:hypothetical protein